MEENLIAFLDVTAEQGATPLKERVRKELNSNVKNKKQQHWVTI